MEIIIEIVNPKTNLSKRIDVTNYTKEEKIKTYSVYTKAGFGVYLAEGIEEMIQNSKKYEYIKDSRCANIITGGNFGNAHFAEKYQGFDLARGRYEVNPFTQERRYF